METLGNIYENRFRHVTRRVKLTENAQLEELVYSVAVERLSEHELIYWSEPIWERGEGEVVAEQQPPRASDCEVTTS
jgi:hypothetical protein